MRKFTLSINEGIRLSDNTNLKVFKCYRGEVTIGLDILPGSSVAMLDRSGLAKRIIRTPLAERLRTRNIK